VCVRDFVQTTSCDISMMRSLHNEIQGRWAEEFGKITGKTWKSFFMQMVFVYAGCDTLIPDAALRMDIVLTHRRLFGWFVKSLFELRGLWS